MTHGEHYPGRSKRHAEAALQVEDFMDEEAARCIRCVQSFR